MSQSAAAGVATFVAYGVVVVSMGAIPMTAHRWWPRLRALPGKLPRRRRPPKPSGRPIEEIAWHARRLRRDWQRIPPGRSFARAEGLRRAYDEVLAEGCRALGIEDALTGMPPGPDRDAERLRVEYLLGEAGLGLDAA